MAELMHDHDHDHPDPEREGEPGGPPMDAAGRSLAEALRVSFMVLTGIMVLVVLLFLMSGIQTVQPHQVGIKKVFGRRTGGIATQGLAYNWPYPIGEIELVSIKEQKLSLDDFWMNETPEDKTKDLMSRSASAQGLRPGWDGALLTGDRNLLHVQLACTYSIQDPVAYKMRVQNLEDAIHSAVCGAAIRAAAKRTADAIQRTEQRQFERDVQEEAQQQLNLLMPAAQAGGEAVRISSVLVTATSWPLKALPAFSAAQRARNEAEKRVSTARAEAAKTLNAAAGAGNVRKLVGEPWLVGTGQTTAPAGSDAAEDYNLVGRYSQALKEDPARARALLEKIDAVLLSSSLGGDASRIMGEAKSYRTATKQDVAGRADAFRKLLDEYRKAPDFMIERLWAAARDDILNSPTIEKFYLTFNSGRTVVRINRDPEVVREIMRELRKAAQEEEAAGKKPGGEGR